MAGVAFTIQSAASNATTTSTKTLAQVVAATNQRVKVKEISISFQGTNVTAAPIEVDILRQTTAGTMSANTPSKVNSSDSETLQTTAQENATAEPTAGAVLYTEFVHPQTGFLWQAPFGGEFIVPGGTRLGVRVVTPGASVNFACRMVCEE